MRKQIAVYVGLFLIALLLALLWLGQAEAQWLPRNSVKNAVSLQDGALLEMESGFLRFTVCTDAIIRIEYSLERDVKRHEDFLVTKKEWLKTEFGFRADDPKIITLSTARLRVEVTKSDGSIIFYDSAGHKLTQENTRTLTPVEVNGEKTYRSER